MQLFAKNIHYGLKDSNRRGSKARRNSIRQHRTGGVLVLLVLLLTLLIAMVAFAVDIGRVTTLRSELQNVVDSGTLAAQIQFRANPNDVNAAKKVATDFVRLNQIGSKLVPANSIVVETGNWDSATRTFTSSATTPNSVHVFARQDNEPYIFGKALGHNTFGVPASAIASGASSSTDIMMTLDLSGSMLYEGRIEALRASAPIFVDVIDELGNSDQIGVMGLSADPGNFNATGNGELYNSGLHPGNSYHAGVLERRLTTSLNLVKSRLTPGHLKASKYNGWTGTGAALGDSAHYLTYGAEARSGAKKIIVLMTDGHANRPSTDGPGYARQMATYAASKGITVYTISLGNASDEVLNEDIADMTGGKHFLAKGQNATILTAALTTAFKGIIQEIKSTRLVK